MGYIKFIVNGNEVKVYAGYMEGVVFTSTGSINYSLSRPTIKYWGDRVSDKINLFEATSIAIIDNNGVQRTLNLTTRNSGYTISMDSNIVKKTTGLYFGENVKPVKIITRQATGFINIYQLDPEFGDFQPILGFIDEPKPNQKITSLISLYPDTMFFQCEDGLIGITPTNLSNTWHVNIERSSDEVVPVYNYPFSVCKGKWRYLKQIKELFTPATFNPVNMLSGLGYENEEINKAQLGSTFQSYIVLNSNGSSIDGNNNYIHIQSFSIIALNNTDIEPPPTTPEPDEGGDGEKDDSSDEVEPPNPSIDLPTNSRLFTLYRIEIGQLDAIGGLIWSKDFTDSIFGVNQSPIDAIIDIYALPVNEITGSYKTLKVGNTSTDISAQVPNKWNTKIDAGSIYVSRYYDDFVDYTSSYSLYLPFVGMKQLPNIIIGCTISIQYNIDLLTGNCVVTISLAQLNSNLRTAMYTYEGNCSYSIPYTAQNLRNQAIKNIKSGEQLLINALSKDVIGAVKTLNNAYLENKAMEANVITSDSSGNNAYLNIDTPYLIITRTKKHENSYNNFSGYANMSNSTYAELSGFTQIYNPHVDISTITDEENRMIERLLTEGVIF